MNEFNGRAQEYMMLKAGIEEATKTVAQVVTRRTRRGFASEGEQWAALLENLEAAKATEKRAETLHKELWAAIKDENPDAFAATLQEMERQAQMLACQWAYINMLTIQAVEVSE